jgi:protein TonB
MDEFKVRMNGLPVGMVSAIIVTMLLFIALPLLTHFQPHHAKKERVAGMLISTKPPPPPPSEDRDKPQEQEMTKKELKPETQRQRRVQPRFEAPRVTLGAGGIGVSGVKIAMVSDFKVSNSLFMSAFNANEVDKPPSTLRSFPPQYPFLAKRDGIEGKVMLRIVVNAQGEAEEAEVTKAEPEGYFEEAALKTVKKYKFRPAMKGGKPVNCIVYIPISFNME